VGFVMLALLGSMLFDPTSRLPVPPSEPQVLLQRWRELERLPGRLEEQVLAVEPSFNWPPVSIGQGRLINVQSDGSAWVQGTVGESSDVVRIDLPLEAIPDNVQQVGLALVARFPVSLELAGIILLLAMFGAVVLARKQIELSEDEVREAAGLPKFALEEDEADASMTEGGAR
jgi:hypothetical protein